MEAVVVAFAFGQRRSGTATRLLLLCAVLLGERRGFAGSMTRASDLPAAVFVAVDPWSSVLRLLKDQEMCTSWRRSSPHPELCSTEQQEAGVWTQAHTRQGYLSNMKTHYPSWLGLCQVVELPVFVFAPQMLQFSGVAEIYRRTA